MSVITYETRYATKGEFKKRVERKNTKSDMAWILADFHWDFDDDPENEPVPHGVNVMAQPGTESPYPWKAVPPEVPRPPIKTECP